MFDTVKRIWALGKCAIEKNYSILFYVHNHITLAVAAMDSCFVLIRTHQHGVDPGKTLQKCTPIVNIIVDHETADK